MEKVTPFDWHRMFIGSEPPLYFLEILFRVSLVYGFAVVVLRLMGKRGNANLSTFQTVVVIALGSASGDVMFYPQIPLLYAFLVILAVVAFERLMVIAQLNYSWINTFLEGKPLVMVKDGQVIESALEEARLRRDEVMGMLREKGIENTSVVRLAFLERSGQIAVYQDAGARDGQSTFPSETHSEEG